MIRSASRCQRLVALNLPQLNPEQRYLTAALSLRSVCLWWHRVPFGNKQLWYADIFLEGGCWGVVFGGWAVWGISGLLELGLEIWHHYNLLCKILSLRYCLQGYVMAVCLPGADRVSLALSHRQNSTEKGKDVLSGMEMCCGFKAGRSLYIPWGGCEKAGWSACVELCFRELTSKEDSHEGGAGSRTKHPLGRAEFFLKGQWN